MSRDPDYGDDWWVGSRWLDWVDGVLLILGFLLVLAIERWAL